jgi:4-hydroxybenzoate polyprenyltransferase
METLVTTDLPPPVASPPATLLSYLRLMRLPNVFTALADIAMGFVVTRHSATPVGALVALGAASALLYTAGMVLNDAFDIDIDTRERPERPLPSGQISLSFARTLGFAMLFLGLALGWLAGIAYAGEAALAWRSGAVATLLAAGVVLYDAVLKRTFVGPLGMGLCRFLNVLLGMSVAATIDAAWPLGFGPANLLPAAGIGTYIVGVTWFARSEATRSQAIQLTLALVVMVAGIVILGLSGGYIDAPNGAALKPQLLWALLLLLSLPVVRRCGAAIMNPSPQLVQAAVKRSILSLIFLDAAMALVAAPPLYAICILALLVPTLLLGRWVYST